MRADCVIGGKNPSGEEFSPAKKPGTSRMFPKQEGMGNYARQERLRSRAMKWEPERETKGIVWGGEL